MKPYDFPDAKGHFGPYGGVFVAETLMHALDELRAAYDHCRVDPAFIEAFNYELKHFVGRPSRSTMPAAGRTCWAPRSGSSAKT